MSGLKGLRNNGSLSYVGHAEKYRNYYEFQQLVDACCKKEWIPFLKESFAGAETVMAYIGRYTHRIAVSNSRILSMDKESVTFRVKDYRNGGAWKEETISGIEFIRRFLMHVLPKGFVKIRHYGLLGNRNKKAKIPLCRNLIGCIAYISRLKGLDSGKILKQLYGIGIYKCPCCGGQVRIHKGSQKRKETGSSA